MSHKGGKMCQMASLRLKINEHMTSVGEEILCVLDKQQRGADVRVELNVRVVVLERLHVAAEFMCNLFQREIETLETLLEKQNKCLDTSLYTPDFLLLPVCKEEVPIEQHERNPNLIQEESEPPQIEVELQELIHSPEEAAGSTLTLLAVKHEDDENRETEPLASTSTEHMKTQADVEHCGTSQTAGDDQLLSSECSEADTEDSDEWQPDEESDTEDGDECRTRDDQPSLNTLESHKTQIVKGQTLSLSNKLSQDLKSSKQTTSVKSHKGNKGFNCTLCGTRFGQLRDLNRHMRIHTGEKSFTCTLCDKGFARADKLKLHMRTHTGEKPFTCTVCAKGFARKDKLKRHMRSHTGEKPFTCTVCANRYTQMESLKMHMRTHTEEQRRRHADVSSMTVQHMVVEPQKRGRGRPRKYPVSLPSPVVQCVEDQPKKQADKNQQQSSSDGEPVKQKSSTSTVELQEAPSDDFLLLPVCKEEVSIEQHERNPNLIQEEPEPPQIEVELQELIHSPEEAAGSTLTLLAVKNEDDENRETEPLASTSTEHMKTQTDVEHCGTSQTAGDDQLLPSECSEAETEDSDEWQTTSVKGHKGNKGFDCTVCGRGQLMNISRHMRIHTGKKSFTCTVCDKGFARADKLKSHMMTHTGEKPFTCTVCAKGFARKDKLKKHMRTHTGEKPFTCTVCANRYTQMESLKMHMRTHTEEQRRRHADVSSMTVQHMVVEPQKRGRGRPRKYPVSLPSPVVQCVEDQPKKRKRGRPRKLTCDGPVPEEGRAGREADKNQQQSSSDGEPVKQKSSTSTVELQEAPSDDFLLLPVCKEEVSIEQHERNPNLIQEEPEPPQIEVELQELIHSPEEAARSTLTLLAVEHEDDENRETEPLASTSTEHMKTQADVEHCGTSQTAGDDQLLPSECSEADTEDSDEWQPDEESDTENDDECRTRDDQPSLNTLESHKTQNVKGQTLSLSNKLSQDSEKSSKQTISVRSHKGKKCFNCTVCGTGFGQLRELKRHMRIHTGEKSFTCTLCDKGFARADKLKSHMRTHTGEKPFPCTVCAKAFAQKDKLKSHMRTHTGEKPFTCTVCAKGFAYMDSLMIHMRVHTEADKKQQQSSSDGESVKKKSRTSTVELQGAPSDDFPAAHNEVVSSGHQERCPSLVQEDPEPPQIEDGQQELLERPEENDESPLALLAVKLKDDDENRDKEPIASTSTENMKTQADLEDCGKSQPASEDQLLSSECSDVDSDEWQPGEESDTEDSDECETRDNQRYSNTLKSHKTQNLKGQRLDLSNKLSQDQKSSKTLSTKSHMENKSFSCAECGKIFNQKSQLNKHTQIHTGEKPYTCTVCGKGFGRQDVLKNHVRTHSGKKSLTCTVCGKVWGQMWQLKSHMITHTGGKLFTCKVCGKGFSETGSLKTHMRLHTGERPFICTVCGKRCHFKGNLNSHMRTHTGIKPLMCAVCGKGCVNSGALKSHMMRHTGEKPFNCKVCGKSFSHLHCVERHMRTHTGEKPFTCIVCGKGCSESGSLKSHMRTHTGEKPCSCLVCGKSFGQSSTLNTHMRTHTGEKPFTCTVCKKDFGQKSHLHRHMRNIHMRGKN